MLLVFPTLLHCLADSFNVLLAVILVEVGCFDIRGGGSVGIIQKTKRKYLSVLLDQEDDLHLSGRLIYL